MTSNDNYPAPKRESDQMLLIPELLLEMVYTSS
jgi:hypothetical protein